jgi:flagellar hook-length control protein FliK
VIAGVIETQVPQSPEWAPHPAIEAPTGEPTPFAVAAAGTTPGTEHDGAGGGSPPSTRETAVVESSTAGSGFKTTTLARRASKGLEAIKDSDPSLALRAGIETASKGPHRDSATVTAGPSLGNDNAFTVETIVHSTSIDSESLTTDQVVVKRADERLPADKLPIGQGLAVGADLPHLEQTSTHTADTATEPAPGSSVLQQVTESIAAWRSVTAEQTSTRFAAWLTPPELGHVWVELVATKDGVSARLSAPDEGVQSLLEDHAPALRQSLADAGIALAEFDVSGGAGDGAPQGEKDDSRNAQHLDVLPTALARRVIGPQRGTINVRA